MRCRPVSTSNYGPGEIDVTWSGFDEMDEVSGAGSTGLRETASIGLLACPGLLV